MKGPLDGIKVLEVANWLAAPATGALLGDMGAEVIKVEPPQGDPWRGYVDGSMGFDQNYSFEVDNRNKRSITLDLGREKARRVVVDIAEKSDVFITNLVPQRRERYGLAYDDLSKSNPRLIYMSFTAYGDRGPHKDRLGLDYVAYWARSGIMGLMGDPGEPPVIQRGGMGDHTASLAMVSGVLAALYERDRTGEGQEISGSLLNTGLWVLGTDIQASLVSRRNPSRAPIRTQAPNPMWNYYQAGDGKWLMMDNQHTLYWPRLCRALGRLDLARDPELATFEGLAARNEELIGIFDGIFATKDRDEWGRILDENEVIWDPVQELTEVIDDPQVRANGYLASLEHPVLGSYETIEMPVRFSKSEVRARRPAPEPGQHTEEVLLEYGHPWKEIVEMRDEGVI